MATGPHADVTHEQGRASARDRRYVYGGGALPVSPAPPLNRRIVRRRISAFNIILAIFAAGVGIVLYIHNILAVNHLVLEADRLRSRADSLSNVAAALSAEVSRKSALERINAVAVEELGLRYPREQPGLIELDPERLRRIREGRKSR